MEKEISNMSTDTKYFSNSTTLGEIQSYLKTKYTILRSDFHDTDFGVSGRIEFKTDKRIRCPFMSVIDYDEDETLYPEKIIRNKSILCTMHSDEEAVSILTEMAKELGGYVNENDCVDLDDPLFWKKYNRSKDPNENKMIDKIYEMIQKDADDVVRNLPSAINLANFIEKHLDEIKKL